jgi:hypothetical protein
MTVQMRNHLPDLGVALRPNVGSGQTNGTRTQLNRQPRAKGCGVTLPVTCLCQLDPTPDAHHLANPRVPS